MIKYVITAGAVIAIFVIGFYIFGLQPTDLELTKGKNFFDKEITKINQSGKTEPYATVTINGEGVPVDKEGNFYKVIDLKNGQNIINVTSKAPFKSLTQTTAIVDREEDSNGVHGLWSWNGTPKMVPS